MKNPFSNPINLLKAHFMAGVLVLIPFMVIAWILGILMGMVWRLQFLLPATWLPASGEEPASTLVKIAFTLGAAILVALIVSVLGWASTNYFGRKILEFVGLVLSR